MFTLSSVSYADLTANKQSFGSGGISTARVNRREIESKIPSNQNSYMAKYTFWIFKAIKLLRIDEA